LLPYIDFETISPGMMLYRIGKKRKPPSFKVIVAFLFGQFDNAINRAPLAKIFFQETEGLLGRYQQQKEGIIRVCRYHRIRSL